MSLHCTSLHYIAANCTRWVQEAPPPVTSDLLPTASIDQFCCCWYLLLLISVLMFIVMSNSEVFCCGIPRYFLKCNPDLPWWMYLQPWPFMNGRANESDWNPDWFFHCWHIAFLILWTHLTKINRVICVFFSLDTLTNCSLIIHLLKEKKVVVKVLDIYEIMGGCYSAKIRRK